MEIAQQQKMASDTQWVIDAMNVKTLLTKQRLDRFLVVTNKSHYRPLALTQPDILMLDEPTRGIDIGAKFEIYQLIQELAKKIKASL